jgi:environmental stress-induced protein Ves
MARAARPRSQTLFLPYGENRVMPWKNGQGITREIAVDDRTPFRWRVSRASLTPPGGPFSVFTGYERHLVPFGTVSGKLRIEGLVSELKSLTSLTFAGEASVQAEVKSPGDDFNLFTHRDSAQGSLHVARYLPKDTVNFPLNGEENFLFLVEGEVEYLDPNSDSEGVLKAGDTLRITRPTGVNLLNLRSQSLGAAVGIWGVITLRP